MDTRVCRALTCESQVINPYCVAPTSSGLSIYECTPGLVCNTTILNNPEPITGPVGCIPLDRNYSCNGLGNLTQGRHCCTNNDCRSQSCYNTVCEGISGCVEDEDCIDGSYCSNGNCVGAKAIGGSCDRDAQCPVAAGCNNSTCTRLFSLEVGEVATNPKFCVTNFTYNDICDSVLVYVNRTLQPNPFECFTPKDWCNYTLQYAQVNISYEPCVCSGQDNTFGHCSKYVIYDYDYAKTMLSTVNYTYSNCGGNFSSTSDVSLMLECGSITRADFFVYIKSYFRGLYWNLHTTGILDNCSITLDLYDPNASLAAYLSIFAFWLII